MPEDSGAHPESDFPASSGHERPGGETGAPDTNSHTGQPPARVRGPGGLPARDRFVVVTVTLRVELSSSVGEPVTVCVRGFFFPACLRT